MGKSNTVRNAKKMLFKFSKFSTHENVSNMPVWLNVNSNAICPKSQKNPSDREAFMK